MQKQITFRLDEKDFNKFDKIAKNQRRTHASLASYLIILNLTQTHGVIEKSQKAQIFFDEPQRGEIH